MNDQDKEDFAEKSATHCHEELKTRFGLSDNCIHAIMSAVTSLVPHANVVIERITLEEASQRGLAQAHEIYHDVDLAFATAYLRLIEDCASQCPLHGDKYATL